MRMENLSSFEWICRFGFTEQTSPSSLHWITASELCPLVDEAALFLSFLLSSDVVKMKAPTQWGSFFLLSHLRASFVNSLTNCEMRDYWDKTDQQPLKTAARFGCQESFVDPSGNTKQKDSDEITKFSSRRKISTKPLSPLNFEWGTDRKMRTDDKPQDDVTHKQRKVLKPVYLHGALKG